MSDSPPPTRFKLTLELKLDDTPPRAVMSDETSGQPPTKTEAELGPAPPYELNVTLSPDGPAGVLKPELKTARYFDPARVGDDGILVLDWQLRADALESQGSTALRIWLCNRSLYYEAEDLEIRVEPSRSEESKPTELPDGGKSIELPDGRLPDGNEVLSIIPEVQSTPRIGPGRTVSFDYLLVTRGPKPGPHTLSIKVYYNLIYVYRELCRPIAAVAYLPLRIAGEQAPLTTSPSIPLHSEPGSERTSQSNRRLHMSDQANPAIVLIQTQSRELHPIERMVPLPGYGDLHIAYRLVKGSYTKPDQQRGCFGYNSQTKAVETYFSTADEAAMEITIFNHSFLHLKHVSLTDVRIFYASDDGSLGPPADTERLPDGNHLAEVLPSDVYFGSLQQGQSQTRYLGLITRGVEPGRFLVSFDVRYEIVDGRANVQLPLTVNPD